MPPPRGTVPDRRLQSREFNSVLRLVNQVGFDPAEFKWDDFLDFGYGSGWLDSLQHEASGSYFAIGVIADGTGYFGQCEPGTTTQVERFGKCDWSELATRILTWLGALETVDEPNEWLAIEEQQEELASALAAGGELQTPLDEAEQQRVVEWVDSIRSTITAAQELEPAQLELLNARLDELVAASTRLTRKDFLNYAIGGVITLGISLALQGPLVSELVRTAVVVVSHIALGVPELPGP